MTSLYLDNNATTSVDPLVMAAMQQYYRDTPANPASQHQAGQKARQAIETARHTIASTLGARLHDRQDQLVFTSGATESNNLAILGLSGSDPGKIVISSIEHPSLLGPAEHLRRGGWDLQLISVCPNGTINLDHAAELITPGTRLVSVMLGNHETGALQPIQEIVAMCQSAGAALHTDATQVVGKIPLDFHALQVDALSFSAHKFHGPPGIGGLLIKHDCALQPIFHGGFQQSSYRPGRESPALAGGMQSALEIWSQAAEEHEKQLASCRDSFEQLLEERLPWIRVNFRAGPRLPHTSNIAFPGLDRQALMMALDQAGLACSTGSACASGSSDPSPVLTAMGLKDTVINGALRFSFGRFNKPQESNQAVEIIAEAANRLRSSNPSGKMGSQPPQQAGKRLQ